MTRGQKTSESKIVDHPYLPNIWTMHPECEECGSPRLDHETEYDWKGAFGPTDAGPFTPPIVVMTRGQKTSGVTA